MSQQQQTRHVREEPQRLNMVAEARNRHLYIENDYIHQHNIFLLIELFLSLGYRSMYGNKLGEYITEIGEA